MRRDDASIHYRFIDSDNPAVTDTLILLHGLGPDMNSWNFALPFFRQNYHVLLYDLRGFGESHAGEEKVTLSLLTEDLAFLIQELNIGNYHVIAQGFSGFIGVKHATDHHDDNLLTLTLMTAPVYFPKQLGNKVIQERKEFVEREGSFYPLANQIIKQNCYPLTEEKASILFHAYNQVSTQVYFELFRNHFADNAAEQLNRIQVPTLLLSGAEDDVYPPELFGASLQFYRNARHYTIPNASFMMQMDQPKLTADWIHQFIGKSTAQPGYTNDTYRQALNTEMYTEMYELSRQNKVTKLDVTILDGFSVYLNGQRVHGLWGKRKAKQLLIYLTLQQSATREELCDAFWPDTDLKSAKNSLRVALHHLKKIFAEVSKTPILYGDKEFVFLQGETKSDLQDFMKEIALAHQQESDELRAVAYEQLIRNVPTNPLPGLYEEWFLDLREHLEKDLGTMALFLADNYEKQHDDHKCLDFMKLAIDYYSDDPHLIERLDALERRLISG
ncbi:alpha/beta hydrolase [Lentibacillus salicampi]|uniref:Alpha/beta hydrolase n=1 Tax=Lentibacillus salicampi TaxID=175306 RepID=A0A4Y9ADQ1_9BACI|nr:alpha/beta hydrolase [Lentibacillus salicampi]TFJ92511.1 alpha/beta hydrolase [Lentibacillus salicampi]